MMPTLMDELETSTTTTSPDPMAALIRGLRARRGLSLQGLGRAVGASAPHLFNIETGRKLPGESLAARIAVELGIEPEVFRAWVRVAGRSDWRVARQAVMRLESFFHDPETAELMSASGIDTGPLRTDPSRIEIAVARRASDRAPAWPGMQPPRQVATASAGPARVLIPVFEPGRDPVTQDSARGRGPALRLDPAHFQGVERVERPFAWPLGPRIGARVTGGLPESGYAIFTRDITWPPRAGDLHVVRLGEAAELAPLLWNGSELLVPPGAGGNDFLVLRNPPARAAVLARLILLAS